MAEPQDLDRRDRPPRDLAARRTLVGMIGTAAVIVVGLGSLAIASGGDPQPASTEQAAGANDAAPPTSALPAATDPAPSPPTEPVPEGLTPVSGPGGGIVGYLRVEDERAVLDAGEPAIQLGASAVDFRGLPVVDRQGEQVGWFLSGDLGFVATAEVDDPDRLAAIEATWIAEHPEAAP